LAAKRASKPTQLCIIAHLSRADAGWFAANLSKVSIYGGSADCSAVIVMYNNKYYTIFSLSIVLHSFRRNSIVVLCTCAVELLSIIPKKEIYVRSNAFEATFATTSASPVFR
jgi:hypothetical protein